MLFHDLSAEGYVTRPMPVYQAVIDNIVMRKIQTEISPAQLCPVSRSVQHLHLWPPRVGRLSLLGMEAVHQQSHMRNFCFTVYEWRALHCVYLKGE